jgi:hypothetical protein
MNIDLNIDIDTGIDLNIDNILVRKGCSHFASPKCRKAPKILGLRFKVYRIGCPIKP